LLSNDGGSWVRLLAFFPGAAATFPPLHRLLRNNLPSFYEETPACTTGWRWCSSSCGWRALSLLLVPDGFFLLAVPGMTEFRFRRRRLGKLSKALPVAGLWRFLFPWPPKLISLTKGKRTFFGRERVAGRFLFFPHHYPDAFFDLSFFHRDGFLFLR